MTRMCSAANLFAELQRRRPRAASRHVFFGIGGCPVSDFIRLPRCFRAAEADCAAIRCAGFPVAVIHGRHDTLAEPRFGAQLAARLGAPFVLLDGAHFIVRECATHLNFIIRSIVFGDAVGLGGAGWQEGGLRCRCGATHYSGAQAAQQQQPQSSGGGGAFSKLWSRVCQKNSSDSSRKGQKYALHETSLQRVSCFCGAGRGQDPHDHRAQKYLVGECVVKLQP